jgi:hypothetical protein
LTAAWRCCRIRLGRGYGRREGGKVPRRILERIQVAILDCNYDLTRHAIDEMAEDGLSILDVECAILQGSIA